MADISKEIQNFKAAIYGEDVRDSMVSLAEKVNEEAEETVEKVTEYGKAEAARVNAENSRKSAETARVTAENARVAAEADRVSAEKTRVSQENTRKSAETTRVSQENSRKSAETSRQSAEKDRESAETSRMNEEKNRVNQESSRKAAETERVNAENIRISAETSRESAEASRKTEFNSMKTASEEATERANQAAQNAEDVVAGKGYIAVSEKGAANGVATLDSSKKIPKDQVPNLTKEDVGLGNVENKEFSDQIVAFIQAASRSNIISGEKVSVLFGKIKKFFADLHTVAFSGSYSDLKDKPTIPSIVNNLTSTSTASGLSAAMGKQLADNQGDLSDLDTTAKDDLVTAMNELTASIKELSESRGQIGMTGVISAYANKITTYDVTFPKAFSKTPRVLACFYSGSTTLEFYKATLSVIDISTTGFTINVYNGHSGGFSPNVMWFAREE